MTAPDIEIADLPLRVLFNTWPAAATVFLLAARGLQASIAIEPGEPEIALERKITAEGFDLLVMGAYGHSRLRNLIIGWTTTAMIRACKVPVLLYR